MVTGSTAKSFWEGKVPCWEQRCCIAQGKSQCIAFQDQSVACWEHEDTLCKKLLGIETCFSCEVFSRYGQRSYPLGPRPDEDRKGADGDQGTTR